MRALILILIFLLAGLQYKLWLGDGSIADWRVLKQKTAEQTTINQRLDARNLSFSADVAELKNGDQALEEQARQTLGMIKEDEVYYQFVDPKRAH